jgi:hypothetical protein
MKKFIMLTLLVLSAALASAQTYDLKSAYNATTTDTVTNTGVRNQQFAIAGGGAVGTIQVNAVRISGTQGGVIRLYGTLDRAPYGASTSWVRVAPTDSLVVPNAAAATKAFDISPTKFTGYRVQWTGTGTMSSTMKSKVYIRK